MNDHFETSKKQKKTQNTPLLWLKIPKIELRIVLEAFFVVWGIFFVQYQWEYHKLSFETIFIVVGSFGGNLLAKDSEKKVKSTVLEVFSQISALFWTVFFQYVTTKWSHNYKNGLKLKLGMFLNDFD